MRSTQKLTKWMTGAALLGALALAVPQQAHAQVSWGIGVGTYPAPVYGYTQPYVDPYAYQQYQQQRWYDHERRERWERERAEEFRREQWQAERYRDHEWREHEEHEHRDRGW